MSDIFEIKLHLTRYPMNSFIPRPNVLFVSLTYLVQYLDQSLKVAQSDVESTTNDKTQKT